MRIVIIGSGPLAPFEVIVDAAIHDRSFPGKIVAVISVSKKSELTALAEKHHIPTEFVQLPQISPSQNFYDQELAEKVQEYSPDLILLLGYTRILSPQFIQHWPGKIINIHGSLLPKYAGLIGEATQKAVLAAGDKQAGCTVHIVTEKVDAGPILIQRFCEVSPSDTPKSLRSKVASFAGEAYVAAIKLLEKKAYDDKR